MKRFYYFSSSHWDREWYLSFPEFRKHLLDMTAKMMKLLEENDYKNFIFDGQTVVLEDIIEVHPEWKENLQKLISSEKLWVGPWYVMPDEFLPSGESLVKNLLIGKKISNDFGHEAWPVGYVCDIFGHIAQLPQILKGFDIQGAACWRGTPDLDTEHCLYWESPDGGKIATLNLGKLLGYGDFSVALGCVNTSNGDEESFKKVFKEYVDTNFNKWGDFAVLADGHDHQNSPEYAPDMIKWIQEMYPHAEVKFSNLLDLFVNEFTVDKPIIKGEQINLATDEKYNNFLNTGTISSRYDIKKANDLCQNEIELMLEPILASQIFNGNCHNLPLYHHVLKKLIVNHAHDSICGCSCDAVHRMMLPRFEEVRLTDKAIFSEFIKTESFRILKEEYSHYLPEKYLADKDGNYTLAIYNPLPFDLSETRKIELLFPNNEPYKKVQNEYFGNEKINSFKIFDMDKNELRYQIVQVKKGCYRPEFRSMKRTDIYTIELTPDLKASSWSYFKITPSAAHVRNLKTLLISPYCADNGRVKLDINKDGSFDIYHYATNRSYRNFNEFIIDREIGNGWEHVVPINSNVTLGGRVIKIALTQNGSEKVEFEIVKRYELADEMTFAGTVYEQYSSAHESSNVKNLDIVSRISITRNSDLVYYDIEVDNTIKDYQLRALFPTGIKGDKYLASQAFSMIERLKGQNYGEKAETLPEFEFIEKPFDGIVAKQDSENKGLVIYSQAGLHAAGVNDFDEISIVLYRSFRRTFATDGEADGQLLGSMKFKLAIGSICEKTQNSDLYKTLQSFRSEVLIDLIPQFKVKAIQHNNSFVSIKGNAVYSALKPCFNMAENCIILRCFNPNNQVEIAEIFTDFKLKKVVECNLAEAEIKDYSFDDKKIQFSIAPHKILTFKLYF
ncbi:MAG: hypothetical protein IKD09_06375 [Lentisphaeria bacterium]|nr:hypothetical protein [Lentisphaeria bacterium]